MAVEVTACLLLVDSCADHRCHVPFPGGAVLGIAAATGELQLHTLSDSQVRNVRPTADVCLQNPHARHSTEHITLHYRSFG